MQPRDNWARRIPQAGHKKLKMMAIHLQFGDSCNIPKPSFFVQLVEN